MNSIYHEYSCKLVLTGTPSQPNHVTLKAATGIRTIEKVALVKTVKITDEQAEILNRGMANGHNPVFNLFFKDGAELPASYD